MNVLACPALAPRVHLPGCPLPVPNQEHSHPLALQTWQTHSGPFASQAQQTHSSRPLALQARQQATTAQAAADACRKNLGQAEAQARDQQAGLQGRAEALLEALRSLVRLALRSAAAMQAATQAMQAAGDHGRRHPPEAVRAFSAPGLCALVQPFGSILHKPDWVHSLSALRSIEGCCLRGKLQSVPAVSGIASALCVDIGMAAIEC